MYWENDMEEIENTAQVLEMEVSALNEKIENIMQKNDFNRETDGQKIRACFRNWASGLRRMKQKNNSQVKR